MVSAYFEEIRLNLILRSEENHEKRSWNNRFSSLIHDVIIQKTKTSIFNAIISSREVSYLMTLSVANEWKMSMKRRWNDTDRRKPKHSWGKSVLVSLGPQQIPCGIEPGPPLWHPQNQSQQSEWIYFVTFTFQRDRPTELNSRFFLSLESVWQLILRLIFFSILASSSRLIPAVLTGMYISSARNEQGPFNFYI